MLRKTLTVVAAMAVLGGGSVGMAYADTPVVKTAVTVPALPIIDHDHHHNDGGLLGGVLGTGGLGLNGLLNSTTIIRGDNHHRGGHFPGGRFGGRFGGNFGGTFWQRGGVILPYSQVASSCGCSGSPVGFGYTEVLQPQQVEVVPVGAVATGDGSCQTLSSVDWNRPGFNRGVRFFRR